MHDGGRPAFIAFDSLDSLPPIFGVGVEISLQSLPMFLLCLLDASSQSYSGSVVFVLVTWLKAFFFKLWIQLSSLHSFTLFGWGNIFLYLWSHHFSSTHLQTSYFTVDLYSLRMMWFSNWKHQCICASLCTERVQESCCNFICAYFKFYL